MNLNDFEKKKNNRRTDASRLSNRRKVNVSNLDFKINTSLSSCRYSNDSKDAQQVRTRISTIMRGRKIVEELMFLGWEDRERERNRRKVNIPNLNFKNT